MSNQVVVRYAQRLPTEISVALLMSNSHAAGCSHAQADSRPFRFHPDLILDCGGFLTADPLVCATVGCWFHDVSSVCPFVHDHSGKDDPLVFWYPLVS